MSLPNILNQSVLYLKLASRTTNALFNNGVDTIGDLMLCSEDDLIFFKGMGKNGLTELKKALKLRNIQLLKQSQREVVHQVSNKNDVAEDRDAEKIDSKVLKKPLRLFSEYFDERTLNALSNYNINLVEDLIVVDFDEIRNIRGVGKKGYKMIISFISGKKYINSDGVINESDIDISDLNIESRLIDILRFNSINNIDELRPKLSTLDDFMSLRFISESDYKLIKKSVNDIKSSVATSAKPINIKDFIYNEIDKQKENIKYVLKNRLIDGNTLESVGNKLGVTRERVRQIEKKCIYIFKTIVSTYFNNAISAEDKCEQLFLSNLVILPYEFNKFSFLGNFKKLETCFLIRILDSLKYVEKKQVYAKNKSDSNRIYVFVNKKYSNIDFQNVYSYVEKKLSKIIDTIPVEDIYYELLVHKIVSDELENKTIIISFIRKVLLYNKNCKIEDDKISPININYSAHDLVKLVMKATDKPLHFTKVQELINEKYNTTLDVRKVHGSLGESDDFIRVGKGIYALSNSGYSGQRVNDLVYSILKDKGEPLSIKHLSDIVLSKKKVTAGTVYASIDYPGEHRFARFPKNRVGLVEWNRSDVIEKRVSSYKYNAEDAFDILEKEGKLNGEFTTTSYHNLIVKRFNGDASIKRSTISQLFQKRLLNGDIALVGKPVRCKSHIYKLI